MLFALEVSTDILVLGALTGLTYAVLATGIVLVYRATKVINFAHGEIGAFGAAVLAKLVLDYRWNFFLALLVALAVGSALGAAIELGVVRRLFHAPRLVLLVATIGVAQLVFVMQLVLPGVDRTARYPTPLPFSIDLGDVALRSEHLLAIVVVPVLVAALAYFLTRTPFGIDVRASAENPDRAELVGISTKRVSTIVWVIAAVLSTVTAVLIAPLRGTIVGLPAAALGPGLLLRALTAAMVGRLLSLPLTLVGGVAVGVVEAILFVNIANPGAIDAVLFVALLVLLLRNRGGVAMDADGAWSLAPKSKPVAQRLRAVWWVRHLGLIVATSVLAIGAVLPVVFTSSAHLTTLSRVAIYALVGLSVTVLTGWGGQLSLGQFAFVGLGAMVTSGLVDRGMGFGPAVGFATVAGVMGALLVGFPALRVGGMQLAIATLGFAVASSTFVFSSSVFLGEGTVVYLARERFLGFDLASQRTYYYFCLLVLTFAVFIVSRLRSSGIGRSIIAVRENEKAAASFTVSPARVKLIAFAVSGGLAALAGALLGGLLVQFNGDAFTPEDSLQIVAMAVIGGIGSIGGAVLGAIYVVGLPAVFDDNATIGLATSGAGLLLLLLYLPGGLVQVVYRLRDLLLGWLVRRLPVEEPTRVAVADRATLPARAAMRHEPEIPAVVAQDIVVTFGGRLALSSVTVEAAPGEVVGLIGSNGAGKSTLMNVIGGYLKPDAGRVELFGRDVSSLRPHDRAASGMGRVFQDARLFGALTVEETVKIALEGQEPSELVPDLLGLAPSRQAERRKTAAAADFISFLGLGRYADTFLSDLSTGSRRIVELTCLLAQGSSLLLLDEPTAGVAQRETEAFGPLITRVQRELGATIIIIEHDMPLVMSISDRIYCLSAGREVTSGPPLAVRNDPRVIASYLGTDARAVQRSGSEAVPRHLEKLTRTELLALAQQGGLSGVARLRKDELIDALEAAR